ncbi:hypothetical protein A2U01_0006440, partial [Trifolium medium]|nr:hypothetical protein [Trifolium medium]
YRQWVKERVQEVKLPFIVKALIPPWSPEPIPISIEEADELKATIAQLNKEKEELADELRELWKRSEVEGKKLKEELEDAKQQLNSMANEYKGYVLSERLQKEAVERTLGVHWKSMFSRLAKLVNDVIETIPTKLEAADATIHPLNTPDFNQVPLSTKDYSEKNSAFNQVHIAMLPPFIFSFEVFTSFSLTVA